MEEYGVLEASVTSPNYPDQTGQGKICRWVVKVRKKDNRGTLYDHVRIYKQYNYHFDGSC